MADYTYALQVATEIVQSLRLLCERIEIAGSIARQQAEVGDIEIVAIPRKFRLCFGQPPDPILAVLEHAGWEAIKNGERYKQLLSDKYGLALDLFLVLPPAQWGVIKVLRTGPAEFSHWVVTNQKCGGALPDEYRVSEGRVCKKADGTEVPTPEEQDFLDLLGLGWIEPEKRAARWDRSKMFSGYGEADE